MWRDATGGSAELQRSDIAAFNYAVNAQGPIFRCYESDCRGAQHSPSATVPGVTTPIAGWDSGLSWVPRWRAS